MMPPVYAAENGIKWMSILLTLHSPIPKIQLVVD
jgi:hypothetical protein